MTDQPPASFARARAERDGDNKLWTVRDCLAEIVRAIDAGEVAYESVLVLAICATDAGELERWRAGLALDREAHVLMAADALFKRAILERRG